MAEFGNDAALFTSMPARAARLGPGVIRRGSAAAMNEDLPQSVMYGHLCALMSSYVIDAMELEGL